LGSKAPLQAMKDWHKLKPELFKKQPYYLPGCDIYNQIATAISEREQNAVATHERLAQTNLRCIRKISTSFRDKTLAVFQMTAKE